MKKFCHQTFQCSEGGFFRCHAGRGGAAQVSRILGFGHGGLEQFRSWSQQAREVPRPCKDDSFHTLDPRGPLKRERPPGPPHQGPQGQHIHNPLPLPKETEKAGNGARRPARQLLGTPAQARPPKGRRRAQAGAPRPLRAALRRRAGPRLSGWRLEGPRRRGTARVTGSAQRPADSRCPHRLSPLACHRPN